MKNIPPLFVVFIIGLLMMFWFSNGIRHARTDSMVIALTFDDGPNPTYTEHLLRSLEEKQVKATFFRIGKQVEMYPETARKIINAGHEISGHSYDWKPLAFKSRKHVNRQLDLMDQAFSNVGITNLSLFRPPGGFLFPWQNSMLKKRGLKHISANVVAGDWKDVDAVTICTRVVHEVRPDRRPARWRRRPLRHHRSCPADY